MPREGRKVITVPSDLYERLRVRGMAEGCSIPAMIERLLEGTGSTISEESVREQVLEVVDEKLRLYDEQLKAWLTDRWKVERNDSSS